MIFFGYFNKKRCELIGLTSLILYRVKDSHRSDCLLYLLIVEGEIFFIYDIGFVTVQLPLASNVTVNVFEVLTSFVTDDPSILK